MIPKLKPMWNRITSSKEGLGSLSFFVATGVASVSNFVFHALISRMLGPAVYGALSSLLNLMLLLSVPLGAVQVSVTRAAASWRSGSEVQMELRRLLKLGGVWAGAGAIVVVVASSSAASFLHLKSPMTIYVLAAWIVPSVLGAVAQGTLMGERRFLAVAIATVLGAGLSRLIFGVVLVGLGLGLDGAVLASLMGQFVTMICLLVPYARRVGRLRKVASKGIGTTETLLSVLSLGGFWLLASMDVVLARHYLPAGQAGLYASAATAGRIVLFLPGAVSAIALPRLAMGRGRSEEAREALRWALSAVSAISLVAAVVLALVPNLMVRILFGSQFLQAAPVVRILGFEAAALGISGLLIYYMLARKSLYALSPFLGSALAVVLVTVFHKSTTEIAIVMLVSVSMVGALMFVSAVNALLRDPLVEPRYVETSSRELSSHELELSMVVPFYNPGPRLLSHLSDLMDVLDVAAIRYEIIAVSDGSTDGSPNTLVELRRPDVMTLIEIPKNIGKGHALRTGLTYGRGEYLGFIDADGDIPAASLLPFLKAMKEIAPDIISGSKRHVDSQVVYPPLRRLYSWGYQQLLRGMFRISAKDTQTGLKLVRRDVVAATLPRMVEKRFAFDLELFVVARHLGYVDIYEVPIIIGQRFGSTVSIKAVRRMIMDTLGIFYRLRVLRYYDQTASDPWRALAVEL